MSRTAVGLLLLLLLLPLTVPHGLYGQSGVIESVKIGENGIYDVDIIGRIDSKDSPGGIRNVIGRASILDPTTAVAARPCVSFGFEYVIHGSPAGAEVSLRMVTRFPDPGIRNPKTGVVSYVTEVLVSRTLERQHYRVYTLEEPWEIVPGIWTFEIWHEHRKLAERSFSVSNAGARDCGAACSARACAAPSVSLASPPSSGRSIGAIAGAVVSCREAIGSVASH